MGEKLKLGIIGIVFLSLLVTSACVSKSAYEEVQARLVQTQQEKASLTSTLAQEQGKVSNLTSQLDAAKAEASSVKSTLTQEQGKVGNLTSQLDAAKAELSRLQNPVLPTIRFVRATAEVSSTGQFTEKTIFKRGEAVTLIVSAAIPVHEQKFNYSATLAILNSKTMSVMSVGTLLGQGEASPGASTVARLTWRRFDTQSWEPGQYMATAVVQDGITGASSGTALTTFTIQ